MRPPLFIFEASHWNYTRPFPSSRLSFTSLLRRFLSNLFFCFRLEGAFRPPPYTPPLIKVKPISERTSCPADEEFLLPFLLTRCILIAFLIVYITPSQESFPLFFFRVSFLSHLRLATFTPCWVLHSLFVPPPSLTKKHHPFFSLASGLSQINRRFDPIRKPSPLW